VTDWSLTLSAPAKINLYLGVHTERDDRGYHKVDSLMAAVGLVDTVTVTPAQALTVQTIPTSDFPMQKNTAYRPSIMVAKPMSASRLRSASRCVPAWAVLRRMPRRSLSPWQRVGVSTVPIPRWTTSRAALAPTFPSFCMPALHFTWVGETCWQPSTPHCPRHPSCWSSRARQAFQQLKPIDVLTRPQRLRTSPERLHLPFAREMQRRPTHSFTTTWVSFPRRWSRGSKRCSTGSVHRTVPLPQTCAVRVPARLLSAIAPPRQPIFRQPLIKTAGGLMQRSSFPTRFALKG